ncbi:MAG: cysteine desulfurase family protein [Patescibacteria group bacterium UBA2163]
MWFKKRRLYMDFAAATPLAPEVRKEMQRGFDAYANPSSPHQEARIAKDLLEEARTRTARALGVKPATITFTGSGTESNNLAVYGVVEALLKRGAKPEELHIIASGFEHPSLGDPISYWARRGVAISLVAPNEEGIITPDAVAALIRPETVLVSIVAVQSEIGQIQPLREIAQSLEEVRRKRAQTAQQYAPEALFPILHSDASQSLLFVDLSPQHLQVDIATYDAQKLMGPKGVGVLYKHSRVPMDPLLRGGKQERGLRAGTENVAGALGVARATEEAVRHRVKNVARATTVQHYFISLLEKELPQITINGGMKHRIANNINISVPGADGDYLAVLLDKAGVAVAARSACIASGTPSKTVAQLGKGEALARGTIRFSFTPTVTKDDARRAVNALKTALDVIDLPS